MSIYGIKTQYGEWMVRAANMDAAIDIIHRRFPETKRVAKDARKLA